jgi:hypothetical protein
MKKIYKKFRVVWTIGIITMFMFGITTPTKMVKAEKNGELQKYNAMKMAQKTVELPQAKLVAKNFVEKKSNVFGIHDEHVVMDFVSELYNLDDQPIAYYFIIKTKNKIKGYILISANFRLDPVLEYGTGDYYGKKLKMQTEKAYYFGVNKIYFGINGKDVKKRFLNIKNKILKKLESEGKEGTQEYKKIKNYTLQNLKFRLQKSPGWNSLKYNNTINIQTSIPSYKVLNVDRIWQRTDGVSSPNSACGPTTGAMIADYYHDVRKLNVYDNAKYGSWAALINHLYYEMHSAEWGTSFGGFIDGMLYHLEHTMNWTAHSSTSPDFSDVTRAINSSNPIAVEWPYFVSSGATYRYHFVAGIGYDYEGAYYGDYQVAYKDPDGGKDNTATHWFDWSVNANDINVAYFTN